MSPTPTPTPVQVFVRVRPSTEENLNIIKVNETSNEITIPNPRHGHHDLDRGDELKYSFDKIFSSEISQIEIWKKCRNLVVNSIENGKNSSIFTYGQTGSGKTFTMMCDGIIQNTVKELLCCVSASASSSSCASISAISASYLEIYNEKIYDLLADTPLASCLDLRQNGKDMILPGATIASISSMLDFNRQLSLSLKNRSTASTSMNAESSRSHFILQLQFTNRSNADKPVTSKIHLVDLAGSEDNKRTGNSGQRMDESCAINKSLFVLGQVVEALNKVLPRVPYRDSKITRFLQDSLGGSALTLLVACVSPKLCDLNDTYNTLNFATKSSLIKNVVTVNEAKVLQPKKPDCSLERLEALKEWKKNKDGARSKSSAPTAKRVPLANSASHDPAQLLTEKLGNDLSLTLARKVERSIEERVNARIKEIADNFMSSSTFQKAVSEKFEQVQGRIDMKLKSLGNNKENINTTPVSQDMNDMQLKSLGNNKENIITTPVPTGKSITPLRSTELNLIDSPDLEELKETTREKILHIVNRGNLKALMFLKTIGKKRAELIMGARDHGGEFKSIEDLERAGLKPSQIEAMFKANLDF